MSFTLVANLSTSRNAFTFRPERRTIDKNKEDEETSPMTTGMSRPLKWLLGIAIALLLLASLGVVARHFATENCVRPSSRHWAPTPKSPASKPRFPRSHSTASASRLTRIGRRSTNWQRGASSFVPTGEPSRRGRFASPSIEVEGGYVSMLGGGWQSALLPSLLGKKRRRELAAPETGADQRQSAGRVASGDCHQPRCLGCRSRLYDALDPPAGVIDCALKQTTVTLGAIRLPALTGRTEITLDGVIKGVRRDGRMAPRAEIATRDSGNAGETRRRRSGRLCSPI